ncbi:hypothetical protein Vi05172_g4783 [Venturia inaequalis]|nr:hypothetical protein Vi05172_g4783 [Venturia inaequalis]
MDDIKKALKEFRRLDVAYANIGGAKYTNKFLKSYFNTITNTM